MRAVAATTSDPNKRRASYVDMAKRGREMADHTEAMGEAGESDSGHSRYMCTGRGL